MWNAELDQNYFYVIVCASDDDETIIIEIRLEEAEKAEVWRSREAAGEGVDYE